MHPYRAPNVATEPAPPRVARGISGAAGLVVAITFFMPAVKGCNSPTTPVEEWVKHPPQDAGDLIGLFSLYFVAYLLAGLLGVAALGRLSGARWARHVLVAALVVATLSLGGGAALVTLQIGQRFDFGSLLGAIAALVTALYIVSSRRFGEWGLLRGAMVIAAAGTTWFGFFTFGGGALYGVVISFMGSLLLLGATIAEGWRLLGRRLFW